MVQKTGYWVKKLQDISRASVMYGGNFNDEFITDLLHSLLVKEFWNWSAFGGKFTGRVIFACYLTRRGIGSFFVPPSTYWEMSLIPRLVVLFHQMV